MELADGRWMKPSKGYAPRKRLMADLVALVNGHLLGNSDYKSNRIERLYVCAAKDGTKVEELR